MEDIKVSVFGDNIKNDVTINVNVNIKEKVFDLKDIEVLVDGKKISEISQVATKIPEFKLTDFNKIYDNLEELRKPISYNFSWSKQTKDLFDIYFCLFQIGVKYWIEHHKNFSLVTFSSKGNLYKVRCYSKEDFKFPYHLYYGTKLISKSNNLKELCSFK